MIDGPMIEEWFTYHSPNENSVEALERVRAAAREFAFVLQFNVPTCADKTAAFRKLREVVMTANAAIVINQDKDN